MKIRALRLTAFGPFTGRELLFAGDGIPNGALQVVYGANEAGKSTALRAVSGLLFGIEAQTGDAFRHSMTDLRLGAVLEARDGTVMEVVRRKGKKNTLLDSDGNVLDEELLRRLCGSATEATFRALFGLDHVSLREGAEALLAGQGDVGESLFEAARGGGGRGIHRILQELEAEADALFTPKAHKRKLNEAIAAYQQARNAIRMEARSGEGWMKQKRGLDEAKADHQRLVDLLRVRKRELHRLERARRLLPLGVRRERLLQRIAALGQVTLLPPDAAKAREAALHERQQTATEVARLGAEIAEITGRRDGVSVPDWLDDAMVARLADLPDRLGAHRKAAEDRPGLVGALATYQAQADALATEALGPARVAPDGSAGPPGGKAVALGAADRARVRSLSHQEAALLQRQRHAQRAVAALERRHQGCAAELAALPPEVDSGALRRVLRRAEREGDLEGRRQAAREEQTRLRQDWQRRLVTLRPTPAAPAGSAIGAAGAERAPELTPGRILALVVPPAESVDRFAAEMQALSVREERLAEDVASLQRRARAARRKLGDLARAGDVPSAHTLAEARAARADAWTALRAAMAQGQASGQAACAAFEVAAARADEAADRLLREADRVATAAAIAFEQDEIDRAIADADVQRGDLARRRAAAVLGWNAVWGTAGVEPLGADDMRLWLRRFAELCEVARQLEKASAEAGKLDEQVRRAHAELRDALGVMAGGGPGEEAGLETLCEQAAALALAREEAGSRRTTLTRDLTALTAELAGARRDSEEAESALAAWRLDWARAIAPLGLAATASAAEAEAVLEVTVALARKQEEVADVRRRLLSIDRDARQFAESVGSLVAALGADLTGRPVEEAAEILLQRHRDGVQARATRATLEDDLRRRGAAARTAALAQAQAQGRLDALMAAAGVRDLSALEQAEQRSTEMRELTRQLQESEDQILAAADGLSLEEALLEIPRGPSQTVMASDGDSGAGTTIEELEDRADRLREELESLDRETETANRTIGSTSAGLLLWDAEAVGAASAADEAQGHLARVRTLAEEYVRLRLAARLLAREIERYREQHQGPVLQRASALLARLTLGRYSGLRADFDDSDRPVLRCLRADGTKVSVEGLSDGTRDQLYLALRLATLERQASTAEPLPLILDDILIHFDDGRAGAALEVLAEHARSTQVVLFTHHARIVDLAQKRLPAETLRVLRLDA